MDGATIHVGDRIVVEEKTTWDAHLKGSGGASTTRRWAVPLLGAVLALLAALVAFQLNSPELVAAPLDPTAPKAKPTQEVVS